MKRLLGFVAIFALSNLWLYAYWRKELKGVEVYSTFKDIYGFIWFCTEAGLYKYNGSEYTYYGQKDGLPTQVVFGVHQMVFKDTFLFVRGYTHQAVIYDYKKERFYTFSLPFVTPKQDNFFLNFIDDDSLCYLLTKMESVLYNKKTGKYTRKPIILNKKMGVISLGYDNNPPKLVLLKKADTAPFYLRYKPFLIEQSDNYFLFYGFYLYVFHKDLQFVQSKQLPFLVTDVEPFNCSKIFVATDKRGLLLYDTKAQTFHNVTSDFETCHSISRMSNNHLWCSTPSGIYVVHLEKYAQDKVSFDQNSFLYYIIEGNYEPIFYEKNMLIISNPNKSNVQVYHKNKKFFEFEGHVRDVKKYKGYFYIADFDKILKVPLTFDSVIDTFQIGKRIQSFEVIDESTFVIGNHEGLSFYTNLNTNNALVNVLKNTSLRTNILKISKVSSFLVIATYIDGLIFFDLKQLKQKDFFCPWEKEKPNYIRYVQKYDENKLMITTNTHIYFYDLAQEEAMTCRAVYNLKDEFYDSETPKSFYYDDLLYVYTENIIRKVFLKNIDRIHTDVFKIYKIQPAENTLLKNGKITIMTNDTLSCRVFFVDYLGLNGILKYQVKIKEGTELSKAIVEKSQFHFIFRKSGEYEINFEYANVQLPYTLHIKVIPRWYQTMSTKILLVFVLLLVLMFFIEKILRYQKKQYEQKLASLDYQIKFLYNQLQPHYLSNALNSLLGLIKLNMLKDAEEYLLLLSTYFREVIKTNKQQYITVASEIEMLEKYLMIEQKRLCDKLRYTIHIDDNVDIHYLKIPSMCVHPFIENAIKHGLDEQTQTIHINIYWKTHDKGVLCIVENNGKWKESQNQNKDSFGLELVQKRLFLFHKSYFEVEKLHQGVRVIIHFQLTDL